MKVLKKLLLLLVAVGLQHSVFASDRSEHAVGVAAEVDLPPIKKGQSPINLKVGHKQTLEMDIADPKFIDYEKPVVFKPHESSGHGISFNLEDGETVPVVILDGVEYKLKQFHFHGPSEHLLDNRVLAAEVHFVHRNAENELAVVGLLFEIGAHNDAMQQIIDLTQVSKDSAVASVETALVPARIVLPDDRRVFRYFGSLTTPPYSENVKWQVFRIAGQMSAEQVERMRTLGILNTAREEQIIGSRAVLADTHSD